MNLRVLMAAWGTVDAKYKDGSREKEALLRDRETLKLIYTCGHRCLMTCPDVCAPGGWICFFSLEVRIGLEGGIGITVSNMGMNAGSVCQVMTAEN